MSSAIKRLLFCFYLFVLLLFITPLLKDSLGLLGSRGVYLGGALLIAMLGVYLSEPLRHRREEVSGLREQRRELFLIDREGVLITLPVLPVAIALTFSFSYLTSLVLYAFGVEGTPVQALPLYEMLFYHSVIPAIAEELIFRFLPILILRPYSVKWCVMLSSVAFALMHFDVFKIPYALFAGFIFIIVDVITDSVLPSLALHVVNNAFSVFWILYSDNAVFRYIAIGALCALAAVGALGILVMRKRYKSRILSLPRSVEPCRDWIAIGIFVLSLGIIGAFQFLA